MGQYRNRPKDRHQGLPFQKVMKCITIKEATIKINYLEWDITNIRHIMKKGIEPREIEEAIFHGEVEARKGKRISRKGFVIQRYDVTVKAPYGSSYKVILEPVNRKDGLWRCITAWIIK
jgi:hypothetical protein